MSIHDDIRATEEQIRSLKGKLADLRKQEEYLKKHGSEYFLADRLHSEFCTLNHTDGCSWHYETGKDKAFFNVWKFGSTHDRWLTKAREFKMQCDALGIETDKAIQFAKTIRTY